MPPLFVRVDLNPRPFLSSHFSIEDQKKKDNNSDDDNKKKKKIFNDKNRKASKIKKI